MSLAVSPPRPLDSGGRGEGSPPAPALFILHSAFFVADLRPGPVLAEEADYQGAGRGDSYKDKNHCGDLNVERQGQKQLNCRPAGCFRRGEKQNQKSGSSKANTSGISQRDHPPTGPS